jgi:hypothetical protein
MKNILSQYATSIGLSISFAKSAMIPINLADQNDGSLAPSLGCVVGKMPYTYLGLPLGTTKPTVQDLMPLVCKIERKVTSSFTLMSYNGRVSCINSFLTSIAAYALCAIKVNPKTMEHCEKIMRHCLWNKKQMMEIDATL